MVVLAAASLVDAFRELEGPAADAGLDPSFSFAGTPTLVTQVRTGAPADVVAVADRAVADDLARRGLLDGPAVDVARGEAVVVAGPSSLVRALDDLAGPDVRVAIAAPAVPAGRLAEEGLGRAGVLDAVLANVVTRPGDVKAVAAVVGQGEADAGVVYATDLHADPRLRLVARLPASTVYSAAVLRDAGSPGAARRFVALLTSPDGRRVLREAGFSVPAGSSR